MRICVYAASSGQCDPAYHAAAFAVGQHIARAGATLVYGGGSAGSMGAVANGALSEGGETRAPMAVCVIGGMITSTILTLVVIPSVYLISERWVARLSKEKSPA